MPATLTAEAAKARFLAEQRVAFAPARLAVECAICGSDYGGNSWTTMAEAEQVAEMLGVGPGDRLLEVGAGSGWPGLYVAGHTGCDLVMSDIPHLGLGTAMARAEADGLAGRYWAAVADGGALPFADASFDAISHSDVLCCLPGKFETLASTRRAVRPGGRTVFSVISIPPGLTGAAYERAAAAAEEENGEAIQEVHGDADFAARLARRKLLVVVLEEGLARRELFAATATSRALT